MDLASPPYNGRFNNENANLIYQNDNANDLDLGCHDHANMGMKMQLWWRCNNDATMFSNDLQGELENLQHNNSMKMYVYENEEENSSFIKDWSKWTAKIKRQKILINGGEKSKIDPCA